MGGRAGSGGGMSRNGSAAMRTQYASSIDSDLAYTTPGGAVGKIIGNYIDEPLNELKETLRGIKDVKSVYDVNMFSTKVDEAFAKATHKLRDKRKLVESNSELAQGRAKETYRKALQEFDDAIYRVVGNAKEKGYGSEKLIPLNAYLIKKEKWK